MQNVQTLKLKQKQFSKNVQIKNIETKFKNAKNKLKIETLKFVYFNCVCETITYQSTTVQNTNKKFNPKNTSTTHR